MVQVFAYTLVFNSFGYYAEMEFLGYKAILVYLFEE
jgi:hypothetical protein